MAEYLSKWIKHVVQASHPWVSSRDIDSGSVWVNELNEKIKDSAVGIICITGDNKDKPWLLFEAGALSKGLSSNRVCTFLVDVKPGDLTDPLALFQHTLPNKESVCGMIKVINSAMGDRALTEVILLEIFDNYWDKFKENYDKIKCNSEPEEFVETRKVEDFLTEILENTRELKRRWIGIESESQKDWNNIMLIGGPVAKAFQKDAPCRSSYLNDLIKLSLIQNLGEANKNQSDDVTRGVKDDGDD